MSDTSKKRGRGRPKGSRNKKKEIRSSAEFREKLLSSLSDAQIASLPPSLKARLAANILPKERPAESEPVKVTFRMNLGPTSCPACGHKFEQERQGEPAANPPPPEPGPTDSRAPRIFRLPVEAERAAQEREQLEKELAEQVEAIREGLRANRDPWETR